MSSHDLASGGYLASDDPLFDQHYNTWPGGQATSRRTSFDVVGLCQSRLIRRLTYDDKPPWFESYEADLLADCGFYSVGCKGDIKCASCGGVLSWLDVKTVAGQRNELLRLHRLKFDFCRFIPDFMISQPPQRLHDTISHEPNVAQREDPVEPVFVLAQQEGDDRPDDVQDGATLDDHPIEEQLPPTAAPADQPVYEPFDLPQEPNDAPAYEPVDVPPEPCAAPADQPLYDVLFALPEQDDAPADEPVDVPPEPGATPADEPVDVPQELGAAPADEPFDEPVDVPPEPGAAPADEPVDVPLVQVVAPAPAHPPLGAGDFRQLSVQFRGEGPPSQSFLDELNRSINITPTD